MISSGSSTITRTKLEEKKPKESEWRVMRIKNRENEQEKKRKGVIKMTEKTQIAGHVKTFHSRVKKKRKKKCNTTEQVKKFHSE